MRSDGGGAPCARGLNGGGGSGRRIAASIDGADGRGAGTPGLSPADALAFASASALAFAAASCDAMYAFTSASLTAPMLCIVLCVCTPACGSEGFAGGAAAAFGATS